MINILPAQEASKAVVEAFFGEHWHKQTDKDDLYKFGRFIEMKGEKLGFFALVPCENKEGWLRTLYFKEDFSPAMIMLGIDWIKEAAQQAGLKRIYAFSHSSSTDTLFKSWGFENSDDQPKSITASVDKQGNWWMLPTYLSTAVDKSC
ncbi:hypothetical protein [Salirhabdus sp. Marseille-P4669]|uniref:hypothetical protein n=1 Tax=Salirhabdus sp. Marseille-P4669 TaxID=2042310 RepID=UPI000C7B2069|nr:hypothetical protein [Salirhabdus sp. Marseille-P4669]